MRRPALIALLAAGLLLVGCDSGGSGDDGALISRQGNGKTRSRVPRQALGATKEDDQSGKRLHPG